MAENAQNRSRRVGELIQRELATMLTREVKDPRLKLVSITAVDVTRDMSLARVYYTVINQAQSDAELEEFLQRVKAGLDNANGFLRYQLGQRIQLRTVPRLEFRYDESILQGAKLTRLIDDVIEDDKRRSNHEQSDEQ
jgi:ribosome-binding factor A